MKIISSDWAVNCDNISMLKCSSPKNWRRDDEENRMQRLREVPIIETEYIHTFEPMIVLPNFFWVDWYLCDRKMTSRSWVINDRAVTSWDMYQARMKMFGCKFCLASSKLCFHPAWRASAEKWSSIHSQVEHRGRVSVEPPQHLTNMHENPGIVLPWLPITFCACLWNSCVSTTFLSKVIAPISYRTIDQCAFIKVVESSSKSDVSSSKVHQSSSRSTSVHRGPT